MKNSDSAKNHKSWVRSIVMKGVTCSQWVQRVAMEWTCLGKGRERSLLLRSAKIKIGLEDSRSGEE